MIDEGIPIVFLGHSSRVNPLRFNAKSAHVGVCNELSMHDYVRGVVRSIARPARKSVREHRHPFVVWVPTQQLECQQLDGLTYES